MEINMESHQETKNKTTMHCYTTPEHVFEGIQVSKQEGYLRTHVYRTLFTMAKLWNQHRYPSADE
jgi:hypothetical protein